MITVQAEVLDHDTGCSQIEQLDFVHDAHRAHDPALYFGHSNGAGLLAMPLMLMKHRFHQGCGEVRAEIKHAVCAIRGIVPVGAATTEVKRGIPVRRPADVL
jgi:hypothetical protein